MGKVNQGDIVLVNLNPTKGHEQSGIRPVVVVSTNNFSYSGMVIVCPITSVIKERVGYVLLKKNKAHKLESDSEVLTSQIRTISIERIEKHIGNVTQVEMLLILKNVGLHLGM